VSRSWETIFSDVFPLPSGLAVSLVDFVRSSPHFSVIMINRRRTGPKTMEVVTLNTKPQRSVTSIAKYLRPGLDEAAVDALVLAFLPSVSGVAELGMLGQFLLSQRVWGADGQPPTGWMRPYFEGRPELFQLHLRGRSSYELSAAPREGAELRLARRDAAPASAPPPRAPPEGGRGSGAVRRLAAAKPPAVSVFRRQDSARGNAPEAAPAEPEEECAVPLPLPLPLPLPVNEPPPADAPAAAEQPPPAAGPAAPMRRYAPRLSGPDSPRAGSSSLLPPPVHEAQFRAQLAATGALEAVDDLGRSSGLRMSDVLRLAGLRVRELDEELELLGFASGVVRARVRAALRALEPATS